MDSLDEFGKIEDIAISTRIRLARNVDKYKMPQYIGIEEANCLAEEIVGIINKSDKDFDYYKIRELNDLEKTYYVEDHLISPTLYGTILKGSFLLSKDEKTIVMLNEEDHVRIQVLQGGLQLKTAWKQASEIDDIIEKQIDYAFHEKFGYLTSCPTNVGTGMRASVMVHLPALGIVNSLEELVDVLRKVGLTLRGIYGEGTQGIASIYQISNQTTLGLKEEEIIEKLNKIINHVIDKERSTRKLLLNYRRVDLEDRIFRPYGLITNNRQIDSREAMTYLSDIKLGADLKILPDIESKEITKLMVNIQPAKLQFILNKKLDKKSRDIERSKYIINFLNKEG